MTGPASMAPTDGPGRTVVFRPFPGYSFTITGQGSDAGVIGEIDRSGGLYQRDLAGLLRRLLPADGVVIDAGAHVGVLTLLTARLCPLGHVYAFEPAPASHEHLVANLAANQAGNVTPVRAALHDTDGTLAFNFNEINPGGSSVRTGESGGATTTVSAVRLDTWAATEGLKRLDLVKLDVEGDELAALDGMAATLARFRPLLVVECNPVALRRFGHRSWQELLARLQTLGSTVAVVGPGGTAEPVRSADGLRRQLGDHGVVDLVVRPGASPRSRLADFLRGLRSEVRARREHPRNEPPVNNFVVQPDITLSTSATEVTGAPNETVTVPVRVVNHSGFWLSSAFPHHPVRACYRWADDDGTVVVPEGHRTSFPEPIPPGATGELDVTVQLPPASGRYQLIVTLLQEEFAWLDWVEPGCAIRVPATVG